jgi:hypothetical protein
MNSPVLLLIVLAVVFGVGGCDRRAGTAAQSDAQPAGREALTDPRDAVAAFVLRFISAAPSERAAMLEPGSVTRLADHDARSIGRLDAGSVRPGEGGTWICESRILVISPDSPMGTNHGYTCVVAGDPRTGFLVVSDRCYRNYK